MIALNVFLKVDPDKQAEFESTFASLGQATRDNEPGVLTYRLVKVRNDATAYRVMEIYQDQAALDSHMRSEWFATFGPALRQYLAEKPVMEMADVVA